MEIPPLITWFSAHWQDIKEFFNSAFFIGIVGAFAASFAGAYGAQRLAERNRYQDQLLKEIRDTNAATSVSFGICNSLLAVKDQHIRRLKEDFEAHKKAFLDFQAKHKAGQLPAGATFRLLADFQTLSLPPLSIIVLQTQVFEKLSLTGRPLNLATILGQTLHGLTALLEKRNELIEIYKGGKTLTPQLYFGVPQSDGNINEDYSSAVAGIYSQTDDGIFFSRLLCEDLVKHGKELAGEFTRQFRKAAPRIGEPRFDVAEEKGLMPDPKNYADWSTAFQKR